MSKISLRPMSSSEYEAWSALSRANYAKNKESEGLSAADARDVAEKSFQTLLPQGIHSPDQYLYQAEREDGTKVGVLWWGVQSQGSQRIAWVYDIMVDEDARGKGYGRATMEAAEADVRAKGFSRFGLHVFGYNTVARNLYRTLGFAETNVIMYKDLT